MFLTNMIFFIAIQGCSFFLEGKKEPKEKTITYKKEVNRSKFSDYLQTIKKFKKFEPLPLIDVEVSLSQWPNISDLINEMNKGGVALAGITSPEKNKIAKAIRRFPKRFFPLTQESSEINWRKKKFTNSLTKQINSGALGIGKITFQDKKRYSLDKNDNKNILRHIINFTSKMKIPVMISFHPSNKLIDSIEKNLRIKPKTKIIWTQIGRIEKPHYLPSYGHGLIRALTIRHPNLLFTITTGDNDMFENKFNTRKNYLFDSYDYFSIDWKNLIEAKISHFMFGVTNQTKKKRYYSEKVNKFRRNILRNFSFYAQDRIAYKNAIKIFFKK